jgi:hypothetical protein
MPPSTSKRSPLSPDEAEKLAIDALGFLAGDEGRLAAFLHATGLSPADIRAESGSRDFLAGLLDYIAADESLLLVFTSEQRIDPASVLAARRTLAPGSPEAW